MPGTGIPAADIVQTAVGLGTAVAGIVNAKKTKTIAGQLAASRPQYQISPLAGEDLSLAQSDLSNGMGAAAEKAYNDQNNGQFSASVGAVLKGGGDVNSIGAIYGNSQDGALKLAQMKDNLRLNQINNYVRASQNMQDAQQTQWQVNKFAPWQDSVQANTAARQNAQQQISAGLNSFGAGIGNAGQAIAEGKQFSNPSFTGNQDFNGGGYATGVPTSSGNYNMVNSNTLTPSRMPSFAQ